jgi:glucose-6-phosphate isomerase
MSTALDASPAWKALTAHFDSIKDVTMKDMFATDSERFNKFQLEFEDMLFDFSKNRINEETMKLLYALAAQQDVHGLAKKMYAGEKISEFPPLNLIVPTCHNERNLVCRVVLILKLSFCIFTCRHY